MGRLNMEPARVFEIFEKICKIPRGSENMKKISDFCVSFAKENNLKYVQDEALNVVIYKEGTSYLKDAAPIILQGHIDMVCQKKEDCKIDFEKDGIVPYVDGDYIKAEGTTLGADNGIAVAMIMSVLESKNLVHPPIEAVFTTDEEIGMIGANKLDMSILESKRMINLDAEDDDELTVSCAGGCDVLLSVPFLKKEKTGVKVLVKIRNLLGGHSGVEIDKGRVNANILMGRILNHILMNVKFNIISVNGGDKVNAIPVSSTAELLVEDYDAFSRCMENYIEILKDELLGRESQADISFEKVNEGSFKALEEDTTEKVIYMLLTMPNGIVDMSKHIEGLVETSLNLGILETKENEIMMRYALRSNKKSALDALKEKLLLCAKFLNIKYETNGEYSPWEYKENSKLRELYIETYKEFKDEALKVSAIHAGLECAVFSARIPDLDCIAIGPTMSGVHTIDEKLSISSTKTIFEILCRFLEKCK